MGTKQIETHKAITNSDSLIMGTKKNCYTQMT